MARFFYICECFFPDVMDVLREIYYQQIPQNAPSWNDRYVSEGVPVGELYIDRK